MAPTKGEKRPAAEKKPVAAEKTAKVEKKISKEGTSDKKKKKIKKSMETYKIYLFKVLKQVHPDIGISGKAMGIMNSFINDIFEKLAQESSRLARYNKKPTITSREIQTAVRLVLPGELAKHAVSEGTKAVTKNFRVYKGKVGFEEHRIMPSVPIRRPLLPCVTSFHGGSCTHRLKHLEKSDRRDVASFGSLQSSIKENYYTEFDSVDDLVNELDTAISLTLHVKENEQSPLKLVSAMKGSREKRGASVRKLSVSWAPEVYDPIPTSLSHTFTGNKKQQHKSKNSRKNWKNNGKKGQKGSSSSSRGSSGKDKKHHRGKSSGNSSGCYSKSIDSRERVVDANDDFDDFTVGSPDSKSYCGTSFLKNSHTKMHYPVAEAL
ncbi:hypothetical protein F8388_025164 [Cannabis sativa]|uniref:Histone H2B n=1 Tax=Cannabis sativa TaxID=3483 RepID=A0A7J6FUP9_CANSA|nr:hypothetical protein F8388_025164 [Cannabis sativa]